LIPNQLTFERYRDSLMADYGAQLRAVTDERDGIAALYPEEIPDPELLQIAELDMQIDVLKRVIESLEELTFESWRLEEKYAAQEARWREETGR
jgi:hypothetical protein